MKKTVLLGLIIAASLPVAAQADSVSWRCVYTESTFSAPFMSQPGSKSCPESFCYYDVDLNTEKGSATINGTYGYSLQQTSETLELNRSAKNIIMGGVDTARLTINRETLAFESQRTTQPSVIIRTRGQCSTR